MSGRAAGNDLEETEKDKAKRTGLSDTDSGGKTDERSGYLSGAAA